MSDSSSCASSLMGASKEGGSIMDNDSGENDSGENYSGENYSIGNYSSDNYFGDLFSCESDAIMSPQEPDGNNQINCNGLKVIHICQIYPVLVEDIGPDLESEIKAFTEEPKPTLPPGNTLAVLVIPSEMYAK